MPLQGKVLLERGLTGRNGVDSWDPEVYAVWAQRFRGANIGVRAPMGVVGIDVDMYKGKQGAATLAAAESEWGSLPTTWRSTSRHDGSAIRWFRVPLDLAVGFEALGVLPQGAGVELIDHGYRYAVVAPSLHPDSGDKYRWLDADGIEVESPPRPEDLPELPRPWAEGLSKDAPQPLLKASEAEGNAYLDGLPDGEMNPEVAMAVVGMLEDFQIKGCRNPSMNSGVFALLQNSGCGEYTGVPTALKLLRKAYVDALAGDRGEQVAAKEFDKTVADGSRAGAAVAGQYAVRVGAFGPEGIWNPDSGRYVLGKQSDQHADTDADPDEAEPPEHRVFEVLGPVDWAAPVPDPEFLIAGVLCRDTFGVNGGPKKSLKTHDNQAMAFAVATGRNLYGDSRFPVRHPGTVLYIVGEGGRVPVRRTMQRMARAYGLDLAEVARDPEFPLIAAFGAASLNSPFLRDELRELLDAHQPELVLIESFYNFHPGDLEASNLYQRGQVIDNYHKFVRSECEGATSMMTDHYRSTAGKSLDLDMISMAGQAENADSWHTRFHRKPPDVPAGEFWMRTGFNSRQWSGTEWDVDWHLGEFDHDAGHHVGEICWDVTPAGAGDNSHEHGDQQSPEGRQRLILAYIDAHPESSKSKAIDVLAVENPGAGAAKWRGAWSSLEDQNLLVQVEGKVSQKFGDGTRMVNAKVWKRGDAKISVPLVGGDS